jgi:membrane protein YdbS with pleckstrin-like domain
MSAAQRARAPAAEWVYHGIWRILSEWFRVPRTPPDLPAGPDETVMSFHPSRNYLALRKLEFWIFFLVVDALILIGWVVLLYFKPFIAALVAAPALALAIVPDIIAYVAIHLRYDCTWYVVSPRSLRVRTGLWKITEQTITYENVQNVNVSRGPVQQLFGIATLRVSTAGAGQTDASGSSSGNTAVLEGIDNPAELRTIIMDRVRASRSAGLGDERDAAPAGAARGGAWGPTPAHLEALREIRDEVAALA